MRTRIDGAAGGAIDSNGLMATVRPALAVKGARVPAANNPQWAAVGLQDGAALLARVTDDGMPVVREIDPNRPRRSSNDPPTL